MFLSVCRIIGRRARGFSWTCVLLGALIGGPGASTVRAQETDPDARRHTMALRDVPLTEALDRFIQTTRADIAYSTDLIGDQTVYCRTRDATREELLRCILTGTGIDYLRTSGGTYLLVAGVRARAVTGQLRGTIVDADTGEPLPQANVLLASAATGTTTDPAGTFRFPAVLAGRHRLVVTYVGYATAVDTIRVPPNGRQTVRIALDPQAIQSDPVIVDGFQQRLPSGRLGRSSVGDDDLQDGSGLGTPTGLANVSRQTGVSLNRPRVDLSVQGGGDGESMTLLDGAPVREPTTLGGLLSAFSPKALDRIVVHKTGFDASEGSSIAGVVDARHNLRVGARGGDPAAGMSADFLSVNARADAGWRGREGQSGSAMAAGRRSVWEAYRSPALNGLLETWTQLDPTLMSAWGRSMDDPDATVQRTTSDVQFADLHAAARQAVSPFQSVYASVYHGTSRIGTTASTVEAEADAPSGPAAARTPRRLLASESETGWNNTAAQVRYDWTAGARTTGRLHLYGSRHDSHTYFGFRDTVAAVSAGSEEPEPTWEALGNPLAVDHSAEGNRMDEVGVRVQAEVSASSRLDLEAGIEPQWLSGAFDIRNRFVGALGHQTTTWQVGSYLQGTLAPGFGTTLTAGTRLTYIPARRTVYAEPRVSVRYDRSTTPVGALAVRLAGGVYRQYVLQSEISSAGPTDVTPSVQFWLPLDGSIAPPRAYHAAADVLLRPHDRWTIRLETYAKWHPRTAAVDYADLVRSDPLADTRQVAPETVGRQSDLMAAGEGRAMGAAVQVRRDGPRLSADAALEVSRVHRRYPGRFQDRFVPAPWEKPLRLSANVDAQLVGGLVAQASWQGTWNRPWALRRSYYDYLAVTSGPLPGVDVQTPGAQRLAPFTRLDVGLRAQRTVRGVEVRARLSVVNVLDRANPYDESLHPGASGPERIARSLPGRRVFALLGIRL